jgi:hypothetical protein
MLDRLKDADARAAWQAIRELPSETRGSVLGTAMAIFRAFGSPRVRAATSCTPGDTENTLNIAKMIKENGTLYLVSPEYEQAELRPVFVSIVQAVYRAAVDVCANLLDGAPLNPPLLLMLDEAGNIAPLQSLPKIAATGAGQGITLMTIWQDRAQIRELYREAERTLISNHTTTVWLPGSQDLDTLKLLSDLIGDQWVASSSVSTAPDGGLSVSEGSERMDVAPPSFLRTKDQGTAVVLTGNTPPALIRTHAYYEEGRWRRMIPNDVLEQHDGAHKGTSPSTAEQWEQSDWPDDLPDLSKYEDSGGNKSPSRQGSIGRAIGAHYLPVPCDRTQRDEWAPGGAAIPDELRGEPGEWGTMDLPEDVVDVVGCASVDLAQVDLRRTVLAVLLETGPPMAVQEAVTFQQLHSEWPHLELHRLLRSAWEDCYPGLASGPAALTHPSNAPAPQRDA